VLIGAAIGIVGIMLIGIMAAIAIPAFLRYIKATKVVESEMMISRIENAVQTSFTSECKFPASASSSAIPKGGAKVIPDFSGAGWKAIGFSDASPLYFRYRIVNKGDTLELIADADFSTSNVEAHTYTKILTKGADCTLTSSPGRIDNEFL